MFLWTWKHFHHVFFLFVKVSLKKCLVSSWEFQRCTCFCPAVRRHNLPGPPCTVSKRTQWNMLQHEDIRVWEQLIGWVVISLFFPPGIINVIYTLRRKRIHLNWYQLEVQMCTPGWQESRFQPRKLGAKLPLRLKKGGKKPERDAQVELLDSLPIVQTGNIHLVVKKFCSVEFLVPLNVKSHPNAAHKDFICMFFFFK